jgi:hypothetical protein
MNSLCLRPEMSPNVHFTITHGRVLCGVYCITAAATTSNCLCLLLIVTELNARRPGRFERWDHRAA